MDGVPHAAITIDYQQESALPHSILRTLAILGIVIGGIEIVSLPFGIFSNVSFPPLLIRGFGWPDALSLLFWIFLNILLIVGCAKCLGESKSGRRPLLVYAYGYLIYLGVILCYTIWWAFFITRARSSPSHWQQIGMVIHQTARNIAAATYPVLLILLLRRPEFRRMFESR